MVDTGFIFFMAKARARTVIEDFPGWMPNLDPGSLPSGGSPIQINLVCNKVGRLSTRRGIRSMQSDEIVVVSSLLADAAI